MSSVADLRLLQHEAADLHRFVGSIAKLCGDRRKDYPIFSEAAECFFGHVYSLGKQTQTFLEAFPADFASTKESVIALSKRQKLRTLRDAWERLHEYVKPALDADSLNLPMPLIEAVEQLVKSVSDWSDFRFVYFHTTEANYLQVPPERAKDIADLVAAEVGGDMFPANIGLVGIPYSQSNGFFLNCLLPHEFGHFLYSQAASYEITTELDRRLDEFTKKLGIDSENEIVGYRRDALERWTEETFCDLVALWLLGPAFSFAYIELTGASVTLGRETTETMELFEFSTAYPGDAARFHMHVQTLKRLGWWDEIKADRSAPVQVLSAFEEWSDLFYINMPINEGDTVPDADFLELYRSLSLWQIEYLSGLIGEKEAEVTEYRQLFPVIAAYLERAIVPSTVVVDSKKIFPRFSVLLNSGYSFKLNHLYKLLKRIYNRREDSVRDISELSERIELWMLKSLEDHRLLAGQKNYGRSS